MGTRFNVLMTVQIPLEQKPKPKPRASYLGVSGFGIGGGSGGGGALKKKCYKKKKKSKSAAMSWGLEEGMSLVKKCADDDLDGACWGGDGESAKMMMSLDTVEDLMDDCFGMPMAAAAATTLSAEQEEEDDDDDDEDGEVAFAALGA